MRHHQFAGLRTVNVTIAWRQLGQFDIGRLQNFFLEFLGVFRKAIIDRVPNVHVVFDLIPRYHVPHAEELMHRLGNQPAAVALALGARVGPQRHHLLLTRWLPGRRSRRLTLWRWLILCRRLTLGCLTLRLGWL